MWKARVHAGQLGRPSDMLVILTRDIGILLLYLCVCCLLGRPFRLCGLPFVLTPEFLTLIQG